MLQLTGRLSSSLISEGQGKKKKKDFLSDVAIKSVKWRGEKHLPGQLFIYIYLFQTPASAAVMTAAAFEVC